MLHPYVFVGNNPHTWVDPTGETLTLGEVMTVVAIVGVLASVAVPSLAHYITNTRARGIVMDFSAGLGDALLIGFGDNLRDLAGVEGVDRCSTAYKSGAFASLVVGFGRIAYALAAKGISLWAVSGSAASIGREQLKNLFRFGLAKGWRAPDLASKLTDAALRASAGRTNPFVNAYGFGVFAAGLLAMTECGEGSSASP
jgi:hypothetical protein